jgi:hypothetical protein
MQSAVILFSITDAYCSWQEDGIITALVRASFHREICDKGNLPSSGNDKGAFLSEAINSRMRAWLEIHRFPRALQETFRAAAGEASSPIARKQEPG